MKYKYLLLPMLFAAALMTRCSMTPLTGGSDNPDFLVTGLIVDENGQPVQNALVTIVPVSFNPVTDPAPSPAMTDTTVSTGKYKVTVSHKGAYSIHAVHLQKRTRLFVQEISVNGDTTRLEASTLRDPGRVKVLLSGMDVDRETGYLFFPGIDAHAFLRDCRDTLTIDSVPAGTLPSLAYAANDIANAIPLRYNVRLYPGGTTYVLNPKWRYCRRIFLNTTSSGAGIAGEVTHFPLLIRLNSQNFNFSQARSDGADIRFSSPTNTPFAHEIERWDRDAERAEVWVNVDTVYGNDSLQHINCYWGNSSAGSGSDGAAVFDVKNGFEAVWHLDEPTNEVARDATANQYHGTPSDTAPQTVPGVIGMARDFDGKSSWIHCRETANSTLNFSENGHYTISAWVYSDTIDDKWHLIVGKSNGQYYLKQQVNSRFGNWEFVEYHDKWGWQITEAPVTVKSWKLLTGVRDGDKQYFYVDGQLVTSSIKPNYDTSSRNTADDVTIGRFQHSVVYANEGFCFFDGKIDEVRMASVVRSAEWIKLCYMNQRDGEKLLMFK